MGTRLESHEVGHRPQLRTDDPVLAPLLHPQGQRHGLPETLLQIHGLGHPILLALCFWVFLAFIIGGAQSGGEMGKNVLYWLMYWIVMAGFEALAWWLAPSNVKFYKWDEQPWWNYNDKETPKNWPSQLGEFVDY